MTKATKAVWLRPGVMRVRSLFSSAVLMRRANGWLAIGWAVMIPVTLVTSLKTSIPFLVAINVWALVASHWSAWQGGVVAVAQDEDANVQDVIDHLDAKL